MEDFKFRRLRQFMRASAAAAVRGREGSRYYFQNKLSSYFGTLPRKDQRIYLKRGPTGENKLGAMWKEAYKWANRGFRRSIYLGYTPVSG